MKKLVFILVAFTAPVILLGQEEAAETTTKKDSEIRTLFSGSGEAEHGGYGAISFNTTSYEGSMAYQIGARAAWLINHKFGIGLDGTINLNSVEKKFDLDAELGLIDPEDSTTGPTSNLNIIYGGLLLEYVINPKAPVHVSIPVVFGGGSATYLNRYEIEKAIESDNNKSEYDKYVYSNDEFFLIQPGVELEMNMMKFMRLSFGIQYRMLFGLDILQTKSDALDGVTGSISVKFGRF